MRTYFQSHAHTSREGYVPVANAELSYQEIGRPRAADDGYPGLVTIAW
jgi:hypothetical protein